VIAAVVHFASGDPTILVYFALTWLLWCAVAYLM